MDRREAVKYISLLLGGTFVGANAFLTGCKTSTGEKMEFTEERIAYMNEIAETILPTTSTPGAKAAKVGEFMAVMVNDCYEKADQERFINGLDEINKASKKKFDKDFMDINAQQRTQLLVEIDQEAKDRQKKIREAETAVENEKALKEMTGGDSQKKEEKLEPHYFTMFKQLTLSGYFTSEIGHKQARRYEPVPGRYEGCVPYTKGEKAWA